MSNHAVYDECYNYKWCISTQVLGDIIDYAHDRRIKIVTMDEALKSVSSSPAGCGPRAGEAPEIPDGILCACSSPQAGGEARITYGMQRQGHVNLSIFDVRGRLVQTLFRGEQSAGEHSVKWDCDDCFGRPAAPGIYFCYMQAARQARTAKIILME
jgi:hypothetical protein